MIRPPSSRIGTLARTDVPSEPVWTPTYSRPDSAGVGSVESCCPTLAGSGCEYRIPSLLATTTNDALVAVRIRSAIRWTGPLGVGAPRSARGT